MGVSILVVMDNSLVQVSKDYKDINGIEVLILVVMDNSLVHPPKFYDILKGDNQS